jgi:hypothetical protein
MGDVFYVESGNGNRNGSCMNIRIFRTLLTGRTFAEYFVMF